MYRQHRLREIGLRRGVSRDTNGLRRGLAGLNRTWTFDPCTPCLKFCTPTFKILPNSLAPTHCPSHHHLCWCHVCFSSFCEFAQVNMLPVDLRVKQLKLNQIHNIVHGKAPIYF